MTKNFVGNLEIREIEINDASAVSNIIKILSDETENFPFSSEDYGVDIKRQKLFIDHLSKKENCILLGAFDKTSLCGLIYLEGGTKDRTYHCCNLGMGVLKKYWAQSIGTMLIKRTLDYAYNTECIAKIDIQVNSCNERAIGLYKKFGFQVEGKNKRALFINGEFYDYLLMGKIID